MGYWNAKEDGSSLHIDDTGIVWGDAPADIMDDAIDQIIKVFVEDIGRPPTETEVLAGVKFSLRFRGSLNEYYNGRYTNWAPSGTQGRGRNV